VTYGTCYNKQKLLRFVVVFVLTFKFLNKGAVKFQFNRTLLVKETDNANVPFILYLTKKNKDLNRAVYDTRFFFVYKKFLG